MSFAFCIFCIVLSPNSNSNISDIAPLISAFDTQSLNHRNNVFEGFLKLAGGYDAEAMYYLSQYYLFGIGIKKDVEEGLTLLRVAANMGHERAKKLYVLAILEGSIKAHETEDFHLWKNDLIKCSDPDVVSNQIYDDYFDRSISSEDALVRLKILANGTQGLPHYHIALINRDLGNQAEFLSNLEVASNSGVYSAMALVGADLLFNKNSFSKALPYLEKSAANGMVLTSYILGKEFFDRKENPLFLEKARLYLLQASLNGHRKASAKLGRLYIYKGGFENNKQAEVALMKAAFSGVVEAQFNLALYYKDQYINTNGDCQFLDKGRKWAQKSLKSGFNKSVSLLEYFNSQDGCTIQ